MSLLYNIRQYGKNSKSIKSAICEREYGILNLIKFKIAPANPYGFQLQAAKAKGNLILRAPTGNRQDRSRAVMGTAEPAV